MVSIRTLWLTQTDPYSAPIVTSLTQFCAYQFLVFWLLVRHHSTTRVYKLLYPMENVVK